MLKCKYGLSFPLCKFEYDDLVIDTQALRLIRKIFCSDHQLLSTVYSLFLKLKFLQNINYCVFFLNKQ